jgi:CHAT domain-containing protein/uncharacterized protein HemY
MRLTFTLLLMVYWLIAGAQPATQVRAFLNQVDELIDDSRYEDALQKIEQSTFTDPDISIALSNRKAEALIGLGRFDEANRLLNDVLVRSTQSKNAEFNKGLTQSGIGYLYLNQGRFDLALDQLTEAAAALQKSGNHLETARALTNLGLVYNSTGKYQQAEEQFQMALQLRQNQLPDSHEMIAASYNNLGLVYTMIDVDQAIEYYEKASAIYEKLYGKDHAKMAISNSNLGFAYLKLELYGDAINYFETALKIWEKINPQPSASKAFVLSNLGYTYSRLNDRKTAMEFYEKALAMYIASQGKKHPDVATTYNLIGNLYQSEDKFDDALKSYQNALIANVIDFNSEDVETNPSGTNFYNGNQLLYSMMYKAQTFEARHLGKTLRLGDLVTGLETLKQCDQLIDRIRQQTSNESDKITLGAIANEVYADGVRISFLLSDVSFRNKKYYREQSFYFAEKSKSAVLQDAISDANAKSFAGVPEDLLAEEQRLKSSLALIAQKLAQGPAEAEEKQLREASFQLNQGYQVFIQNLEKEYPEYFNLKYSSASPSISQIQRMLDSKTAILSYFIDDSKPSASGSRLYTYIITSRSYRITDQPLPNDFDRSITGLRNGVYYMSAPTYIASARSLYRVLIPRQIPRSVKELVILPTGRMSVIPFEVLLSKDVKETEAQYESLPYLINRYAVRYEFSAGLILQRKGTSRPAGIASALMIAPVTFPEKYNLNDLPGTRTEVLALYDLFAGQNISTELLIDERANEAAVKSGRLQDHTIVHLATHGIVDEENPELSRIFLQASGTDDGSLFSGEIYSLQLNADLVALSACQTGLGKISRGEGVIGLSRALVYAGAKNIIVSFWNVADESTAELMTEFYRLLLADPKSRYNNNLQKAKLKMIDGKYAAPYYWAPFILIGF